MTSPFTDEQLQEMAFQSDPTGAIAGELLEARRDAKRYRALRLQNRMHMPMILPPFIEDPQQLMGYTTPEAIDAAIDAALAEGK